MSNSIAADQGVTALGLAAQSVPRPSVQARRPLKILLCGLNYSPELAGVGKYSGEMAAWLAGRGHQVKVVTAVPYYPEWRVQDGYRGYRYRREIVHGTEVTRCPLWVPALPSGFSRIVHLLSYALSSLPATLAIALRWRPDLVLAVEPPVMAAPGALLAARLSGAKAMLHVQDLELDAACSLGLVRTGPMMRLALKLERLLLRGFDRISSISPRMCARLAQKGIASDRCLLFPNWVDVAAIHPMDGPNPLRAELGISQTALVALYSGNFGRKQGLDTIVEAARRCVNDPRFTFVLCGAGAEYPRLAALAAALPNVRLLPLQPVERLNLLLNLADIHLLPQQAQAADLVMPSKLAGMLSSGRPVIAGALPDSQLYDAVQDCGIAVPPGDPVAVVAALDRLAVDPEERFRLGRGARNAALSQWCHHKILEAFEAAASKLVGGTGPDPD